MSKARGTTGGPPRVSAAARRRGGAARSRQGGAAPGASGTPPATGTGRRGGPASAVVLKPRLIFIGCIVMLLAIGLVMVYSASSIEAYEKFGDAAYFLQRQAGMIAAGVVVATVISLLPISLWLNGKVLWGIWLGTTLLIGATAIAGHIALGAQRWIEIGGFGFQPSELSKIAMMLLCAYLIVQYREGGFATFSQFAVRFGMAALVPSALILAQPDLGTALVALVGVLSVLWFGEISKRAVIAITLVVVVLAVLFVFFVGFRSDRIAAWLDPWSDPLDSGYQIINSYYAFSEGGVFGVGLGNSTQKYLYLPYAYNDFIFAVIGEEAGMLGAMGVIALFCVMLYAAFRIGRLADGLLPKIIADTAAVLIGFQAFLNIACVIGVLPITGKPLPFISYGGSSIIATMVLVGIILAVSLHCDVDAATRRRGAIKVYQGRGR